MPALCHRTRSSTEQAEGCGAGNLIHSFVNVHRSPTSIEGRLQQGSFSQRAGVDVILSLIELHSGLCVQARILRLKQRAISSILATTSESHAIKTFTAGWQAGSAAASIFVHSLRKLSASTHSNSPSILTSAVLHSLNALELCTTMPDRRIGVGDQHHGRGSGVQFITYKSFHR